MRHSLPWLMLLVTSAARAEVIDVSEGTNLALAIHPDNEFIVIDLVGGLWRLPVTGGGATPLIPAGSGIAQPRFDPRGESIVFQRWLDGQWDIWRLTLTSGLYEPLTETEFNEREPEFSADGRQVFFSGDRNGHYSLWSLDLDNDALRQLTDEPGDARFPAVDASGELAYVNIDSDRSAVMRFSGGLRGQSLFESARRIDAPSWRPGGGVLLINERIEGQSSDLSLYIDADEPVWRSLTVAEDVFVGRAGWLSAEEYVYAADGALWRRRIGSTERTRILVFAGVDVEYVGAEPVSRALDNPGPHAIAGINDLVHHEPTGRWAFSALSDLWLVDDKKIIRLTNDAVTDASPQFSPNGEWLVFASDRGGEMNVWQLRIASGQLLQLTDGPGRVFDPRVSADGRHIAFLETRGNGRWDSAALKLIDIDRPFESDTRATGLFDAGQLTWQGRYLRLMARDEPTGETLPHSFETEATDDRLPPTPDPDVLSELIGNPVLHWQPAVAESPFVIQAGRLFDGIRSDYQYHVDIHIQRQRITNIVPRGRLPLPELVIDVSDSTIVPGLIDAHAHLSKLDGTESGKHWLRHGVTTVRDVTVDPLGALERAEAWASGQQPGPRLIISPVTLSDEIRIPSTSPIIVSSGRGILGGLAHARVAQWVRDGNLVTGLSPVLAGADATGVPRVDLSTLDRSYEDVFGRIRASGAYLATGLAAFNVTNRTTRIGRLADTLARIMRSTGRIAIGSDAPAVGYGSGFHDELALLAESGIPEDQILRFATAGGAIALGLSLQLGTLEPGRLADLLVIDGDPLNNLGELERIDAVVLGGIWRDIEELGSDR